MKPMHTLTNREALRAGYDALREDAGLLDFSTAAKLNVSGKNAVQFLNGLVSNDVKTLEAGDGVLAAFPTLQGRLLALARIYNTGSQLLLELDSINREKIYQNLARFVPAGDFFVNDVSDQFALLSLQGPRAADAIERFTGQPFAHPEVRRISERQIGYLTVRVASHSRCGEIGFDLFVAAGESQKLRELILTRGRDFGVREAGPEAFEIARVEAGRPREGVDAGESYILLESELDAAVSYTKGCYLGQEIIARIHWRGQPAKRLRGLRVEGDRLPPPGAELHAEDGKKVGLVTSSTHSFALDRIIALGYVHRNYLDPGTRFTLKQGETEIGHAELAELPFLPSLSIKH
jgi:folate-binding protein YgfZ